VTILKVRGPATGARTLRAFTALVGALASELDAVVYDMETRDLWSARSWAEKRAGGFDGELPVAARHITIHSYAVDGGIRSVTLGMAKLGLPDVAMIGYTHGRDTWSLVNAVCQWMVENRAVATGGQIPLDLRKLRAATFRDPLLANLGRGATGAAEIRIGVAERQEGDAENRLMQLTFEGSPGAPAERQMRVLTQIFGADRIVDVRSGDEAMAAASRKAKAGLPRFKRAFAERKVGENFKVKVGFPAGERSLEFMWIELRAWKGSELEGVLESEPSYVEALRRGAFVKVREGDVYDWIWYRADGSREGNETGKILEEREGAAGGD
jgi:uncharacterized protein YegJ (DUF2314 family)